MIKREKILKAKLRSLFSISLFLSCYLSLEGIKNVSRKLIVNSRLKINFRLMLKMKNYRKRKILS